MDNNQGKQKKKSNQEKGNQAKNEVKNVIDRNDAYRSRYENSLTNGNAPKPGSNSAENNRGAK